MAENNYSQVPVGGYLERLHAAHGSARVGRIHRSEAALLHPLIEVLQRPGQLLGANLDVLFEHTITLMPLAPALDVPGIEELHVLKEFERADGAVLFQGGLGRRAHAFTETIGLRIHVLGTAQTRTAGTLFHARSFPSSLLCTR